MHEQDKKVQLTRTDIVQQHTKDQMVECGKTAIGAVALILFGMLFTAYILNNWGDLSIFNRIVEVPMCVLLWALAAVVCYVLVQLAIRLLYLHQGKCTIEIDRVKLLECKTEEEYRHTPGSRRGHTEIVTNQYVHFEKYGKVKSNRPLKNGQECYLLVVLTKKPHVLKFWECDDHEIKGV